MDVKVWWKSKTIWGGLVALAGGLAGLAGFEVDAATHAAVVNALSDAAVAIGALVAILGRFDAKQPIG